MGPHNQQSGVDGVGEFYDQISDMLVEVMGGSMHFGYWRDAADDSSMAQAAEHLTDIMINKLGATTGQKVLDVGCGTGQPACRLARATAVTVTGVTLSRHQVELANRRAGAAGLADQVTFQLADAMNLPFEPESFDAAWLFESLPNITDKLQVLRNVSSLIRPGGLIVATDLVQRGLLPQDKQEDLARVLRVLQVKSLVPFEDYSQTIKEAGLVLEEFVDISDHTTTKTYAAMLAALRENAKELTAMLGDDTEFLEVVQHGCMLLSEMSEIRYVLFVARNKSHAHAAT
jgi:cyclopropane fatty-acyl-phospholipid synthase-like methyltransferase